MPMVEHLHLHFVSIFFSVQQFYLYFYIEPYIQLCKKESNIDEHRKIIRDFSTHMFRYQFFFYLDSSLIYLNKKQEVFIRK